MNLLSSNRTGALLNRLSVSPNGEYISCIQFSNIDNVHSLQIDMYDKNNNRIWKNWKDMGIRASSYGLIDVSNNGNIILSISKEGETKEYVGGASIPTEVYILDRSGNKKWSQQFDGLTDVSISEFNFGILDIYNNKFYLHDINGQLIFKIDNVKKGAVSSDGKIAVILRDNNIEKYDNKGNILKRADQPFQNYEMEINYDGNTIVLFNDELLILDNNLNATVISTPIKNQRGLISISPSGDYILVRRNREDLNLLIYANIIQKIYPLINENVNTNMPTFLWKSNNGLEYIIKIDNEEYKTQSLEFKAPIKLSSGIHSWSLKRIGLDGRESAWTSESNFIISTNETVLFERIFTENPFTIYIGAISLIMVIAIGIFFIRPYYKRTKLKRGMVKTATDWCPHCKKFTGGVRVCPHCGKDITAARMILRKNDEKYKN